MRGLSQTSFGGRNAIVCAPDVAEPILPADTGARDEHKNPRTVCWQSLSGATGTLVFFFECDDLASLDRVHTTMMEDKSYWGKIAEARQKGLFDLASSNDLLMRQL